MIRSRDNPRARRWARLVRDGTLRRRERRALVEGPHLVAELARAGIEAVALLVSESGMKRQEVRALVAGRQAVMLSDRLFAGIVEAQSPPGIAAEIEIPANQGPPSDGHCIFLEGIQDPANIGAILRSAAAFGVAAAFLDRGCADVWSAKVLRAAMGGHFKLALHQVARLEDALRAFSGRLLCTVAAGGLPLQAAPLGGRLGWIFGAEGQGVSPATAARAGLKVRIPMAAGTESLNVAAAAAICLYEAFRRAAPA